MSDEQPYCWCTSVVWPHESRHATISDDGRYRYTLERRWGDGPAVLFLMLNPSTADAQADDPTIRRCVGFAQSWGYERLLVGNLYALRATHPRELHRTQDPVGRENNAALMRLVKDATEVVVAWGATPHPQPHRARQVLAVVEFFTGSVRCLGQTKGLHPRHPLYVRADTPLIPFEHRAERLTATSDE